MSDGEGTTPVASIGEVPETTAFVQIAATTLYGAPAKGAGTFTTTASASPQAKTMHARVMPVALSYRSGETSHVVAVAMLQIAGPVSSALPEGLTAFAARALIEAGDFEPETSTLDH